uniref:Uncharacterized protein n=1 Tax=Rhizophora mucronata TaxID=61149 RepID=A0A2P2QKM7_RHIMU
MSEKIWTPRESLLSTNR